MALFAKKLQERIAELESAEESLRQEVSAVRKESDIAGADRVATDIALRLTIASLEGRVEELRRKADNYDGFVRSHEWVKSGGALIHGTRYGVYECAICKIDPMAATRVLVPEGQRFP